MRRRQWQREKRGRDKEGRENRRDDVAGGLV